LEDIDEVSIVLSYAGIVGRSRKLDIDQGSQGVKEKEMG